MGPATHPRYSRRYRDALLVACTDRAQHEGTFGSGCPLKRSFPEGRHSAAPPRRCLIPAPARLAELRIRLGGRRSDRDIAARTPTRSARSQHASARNSARPLDNPAQALEEPRDEPYRPVANVRLGTQLHVQRHDSGLAGRLPGDPKSVICTRRPRSVDASVTPNLFDLALWQLRQTPRLLALVMDIVLMA
jgi:hypothetical protein